MRRQVPLAITFICGVVMAIQFFIPHQISLEIYRGALDWQIIIGGFVLVLGIGSLITHHTDKLKHQKEGWGYSLVVLSGLAVMAIAGLFFGGMEIGKPFMEIFIYAQNPIQATMFSLLAFFIASAAYRAFRARSFVATLLLLAAIIVMIGRVPIGAKIWSPIRDISNWLLDYPNMVAKRAITLGVGLGMISTALKIILGIERSYLGGGK